MKDFDIFKCVMLDHGMNEAFMSYRCFRTHGLSMETLYDHCLDFIERAKNGKYNHFKLPLMLI